MTIRPANSKCDSSQTVANNKVIRTSRRLRGLETIMVVLQRPRNKRVLDLKYARSIKQIRRRADNPSRAMARGEIRNANGGNTEMLQRPIFSTGPLGKRMRADGHLGMGSPSTGSIRF